MPSFPGVDYLDFDSVLSDEEKLARNTARQFVDAEIMPIIEEYNREGKFPVQLVPQMAELGLFGASLKGYGCAGMSNVEYGLVTQELERGDSGLRSFVSVQSALVMYPIHAFGSDAQKDKWLPLLQQGKAIGCFGLTEPQFGSNPGGMLTRAVKKGGHYILNGEKMWITSGSIADVAVIWAKCEDEVIRGFLVEKGMPGYKAWDVHGKYSLRASVTSGLAMTDCKIPGGKSASRRGRAERAAVLPESGALRHRLGRHRRGDGLLRHGAELRQAAQAIRQQADCFASTCAGKIGVDDHRNHQGAIPGAAGGAAERCGARASFAHLDAEDE